MMNLGQRTAAGLMALSLITAVGCGDKKPGGTADAGPPAVAGDLLLNRVGAGTITAHANDIITLRTLLVDSKGTKNADGTLSPKPMMGGEVKFRFLEQPGQADLSAYTLTTDSNGLGQTTLTLGSNIVGEVKIRADSPGAKSTAVWTIAVQPVIKHIRIIPNPPIIALTDTATATKAAVSGQVGAQTSLQVQVTANTGPNNSDTPLPNEQVTFQFVTSIAGASFMADRVVTTSVQGTASLGLLLGTTIGAYKVIATIPGNITAEYNVNVTNQPPPCHLSSQCGNGYVCVGGQCQQNGGGGTGTCGSSDQMCPIGYSCVSGACTPIGTTTCEAGMCPIGYSCDLGTCVPDDPQCGADMMCPSGSECRNGICYPTDGSILNVTGHWYTMHSFDVHSALPGWLQVSGEVIAVLDEILQGQIPGLPSIVSALIRGLVQAYIPPWVTTVVYLLDNMFTIFSTLRAKGEMDLTAVGGPAVLYGTENWDSFVFYLLSQCGSNIGRPDPAHPPACAEVDVYTADLAQANFATTVHPFTARLTPVTNQLIVDRRQVDLQLAGIIQYVMNQVISSTTGYPSLQGPPGHPEQGALYNLVDCPGIAQLVMSSGIPIDITGICQAVVAVAADAIAQQLSNIVINTNALSFNGQATAIAQPGSTTYAYRIGQVTFETINPPDGAWNAEFINLVNNVPGRWRAARQPWAP